MEVRGAQPEEMPEVLDMIPRVMGATREYFAAAYRNDPWGRPEHSRIVRVDGQIVSHIRLYDRWQRVGPIPVHVGCVGDVCTLPEYRKQGHCRALLEDALRYWDAHGYDFSMIVSGVGVYAACGWVPLTEQGFTLAPENRHLAAQSAERGVRSDEERRTTNDQRPTSDAERSSLVVRRSSPAAPHSAFRAARYEVRRFVRGEDLTAVAAVYAAYNAERSLTTVRTSAYWEKHFSWIAGEIEEAFLVAEQEGEIVAYLRCEGGLRLAEFCCLPGHEGAVEPLLDAILTLAAKRRHAGLQGILPADHPALAIARERPGFATTETSVLLFRLVNLRRLLERLQPLLVERSGGGGGRERARERGSEGAFTLEVGDQAAGLRVAPGLVSAGAPGEPRVRLAPETFFALLFGVAEPGEALAGLPEEVARVLAELFPTGAPVYWRTDVV